MRFIYKKLLLLDIWSVAKIKIVQDQNECSAKDGMTLGIGIPVTILFGFLVIYSIMSYSKYSYDKRYETRYKINNQKQINQFIKKTIQRYIKALDMYSDKFFISASEKDILQKHIQKLKKVNIKLKPEYARDKMYFGESCTAHLYDYTMLKEWHSELLQIFDRFGIIEFNDHILLSKQAVQSSLLASADEDLKNLPDFTYSEQSKNEIKQMIKNLKSNKDYHHMIDILKQYKLTVEMQSPSRLGFVSYVINLILPNTSEGVA